MQVKNSYYWFEKALSPEVCEKIIKYGCEKIEKEKNEGRDVSATTIGYNHKQGLESEGIKAQPRGDKTAEEAKTELGISGADIEKAQYIRDSEVTWMSDQWLYDLVCPFIYKANDSANWRFDIDWHEEFQFTTYQNTGFYSWHSDGGSDWNSVYRKYIEGYDELPDMVKQEKLPDRFSHNPKMFGKVRKLSLTLNLTDPNDYEGGDLLFDFGTSAQAKQSEEEIKIARTQGTIVVFPSFIRHCVSPVTKGRRYSLVNWSLGRPFR